jgi:hypothetical protein
LWCYGLALVFGLVLVGGANAPVAAPLQTGANAAIARPEKVDVSPLDVPLQLMAEAHQAFQNVRDYSCTLIKRERLNGRLDAEQVIAMKIRTKPFSVALTWQAPRERLGQEAVFVAGQNQNMMRVLPKGIAALAGWQTIAVDDPRVLEHSHHRISEAGIGNMIDRCTKSFEKAKKTGRTKVHLADFDYDKRHCVRIETISTDPRPSPDICYRCLLYIDKETHLPIRIECYDRPRPGGNAGGELYETYSFANLRLNVGLREDVFRR